MLDVAWQTVAGKRCMQNQRNLEDPGWTVKGLMLAVLTEPVPAMHQLFTSISLRNLYDKKDGYPPILDLLSARHSIIAGSEHNKKHESFFNILFQCYYQTDIQTQS